MIYDFKCNTCEHEFEIMCKVSEMNYNWACPKCESTKTVRCLSKPPMAIPHDRLMGGSTVPDGFRDVLKNISNKAIGGKSLKGQIR